MAHKYTPINLSYTHNTHIHHLGITAGLCLVNVELF